MRCDDAQRLIESHLDGAFEGEPAAALRAHLTSCAACAHELALAERISRELQALPPVESSVDADQHLARMWRRERTTWMSAAAAVIVVAIVGAVGVQRYQQRQRQMQEAALQTRYALSKLAEVSRTAGLAPTKGEER